MDCHKVIFIYWARILKYHQTMIVNSLMMPHHFTMF